MLTAGSLFSGIGGLDLGLERAGIRIKWQCESNPFCRMVLNSRWPKVPLFTDVRYIPNLNFCRSVDLLVGGFPCPPVSLAGKRNGKEDERWLWPEFSKCIDVIRPKYVIIENVEGLRTLGLNTILKDLDSYGYDAEWDCLSAAIVGAPHIRKRYFIVGYPKGYVRDTEPAVINFEAFKEWAFSYIVTNATFQRFPKSGNVRLPSSKCYAPHTDRKVRGYGWWTIEPGVARMVHGASARLDRHKALGNAVVPQISEFLGNSLIKLHEQNKTRTSSN